jgi:hypothetical protein
LAEIIRRKNESERKKRNGIPGSGISVDRRDWLRRLVRAEHGKQFNLPYELKHLEHDHKVEDDQIDQANWKRFVKQVDLDEQDRIHDCEARSKHDNFETGGNHGSQAVDDHVFKACNATHPHHTEQAGNHCFDRSCQHAGGKNCQHRQAGIRNNSSNSAFARHGLGEYQLEGLPQVWLEVLREHEAGQVDV